MAKSPQQLKGWLRLLDAGWPETLDKAAADQAMTTLIRFYRGANQDQRSTIRSHVSKAVSDHLLSFANRAAEESVQRGDQTQLMDGLAALALGSDKLDPRDAVIGFSLLAHSADKLGAEYQRLFQSALEFSGEDFGGQIQDFLKRDAEDRSIYEMGYKEVEDSHGFIYVRHGDF